MGRIIAQVAVENFAFPDQRLDFAAMVDTGASHLTLPTAWRDKLGDYPITRSTELHMADQSAVVGQICGPVKIEIEGFEPIASEVLFIDMEPDEGEVTSRCLGTFRSSSPRRRSTCSAIGWCPLSTST